MAFKLVVSDPKSRKSFQKDVSAEGLLGKKIGDNISGNAAGLDGYELEITGGSDKDGFPMRRDVDGIGRKRILIASGPGFHPNMEGQRRRKSIRGNTVSEDTAQINAKIVKYGPKPADHLFAAKKEAAPAEKKEEEHKPAAKKEEAHKEAEPAKKKE